MLKNLDSIFTELAKSDSMTSESLLSRLYHYAKEAVTKGAGTIIEIGAYRGAATVALAMGAKDSGCGHIYSIDPHKNFLGVLGGQFSPEDHTAFKSRIHKYNVEEWVTHYCNDSATIAQDWSKEINLLWIDGDHSYEGVATDLKLWLPFVADDGVVILDDHSPDSEVEAAVRDHLPFSRFLPIERIGNSLVLRRTSKPRTLVLCGGMQSSGSTLVSMCFLQRDDLDGVYDLDNPLIQQDFSRVFTTTAWVKMTIGSFRLRELMDLYKGQGWFVRPMLVYRDPEEIMTSLKSKWYGLDGCTGDDPPLYIRFTRYMADVEDAHKMNWCVLNYSDLIKEPKMALDSACKQLGFIWDPRMMEWPTSASDFAYPSDGNISLRNSMKSAVGLVETIETYRKTTHAKAEERIDGNNARNAKQLIAHYNRITSNDNSAEIGELKPCRYKGTRRERVEAEVSRMETEVSRMEAEIRGLNASMHRIESHVVFGAALRFWKKFVNPSLSLSMQRDKQ
jgi:predicted O-methyltransferase YrrM